VLVEVQLVEASRQLRLWTCRFGVVQMREWPQSMPYFFLRRTQPKSWNSLTMAPLYEVEKFSNSWWMKVSNHFDDADKGSEE
jgi:hypothetical protein